MADGTWSLAEAKAKFSEVVEKARTEGPQHVTRNGKEAVVVVSTTEWAKHSQTPARSFVEALLDPAARVLKRKEIARLFARDPDPGRAVDL
ncbi:MAG TPA: type II toxin-antitoxin system Phd/YefM family antitoxin [Caulobacteraceae bacterium]